MTPLSIILLTISILTILLLLGALAGLIISNIASSRHDENTVLPYFLSFYCVCAITIVLVVRVAISSHLF